MDEEKKLYLGILCGYGYLSCCILCLFIDHVGAFATWYANLLRNHPSDDPVFLLV